MKTCNRCGTQNLEWDMHYHEVTGKWKLLEHKTSKGKVCGRVKQEVMSKVDAILCELCSDSGFGMCRGKEAYNEHLDKFHPNGEILTYLDYVHEHLSAYTIKKFWKNDTHYDRYVS